MERAAIMNKAAELISNKHRFLINAATMLGQGKNLYLAEIDSACEVIDYLRFNTYFASVIYGEQPASDNQTINRLEYRPLEGFIYTISPFNFTAIAPNLNTSVAMIQACRALQYAGGNFYINDKPTGAMVGQQPFDGARGSGTNDKAESYLNLIRWVSPRTIKETLIPATDFRYPYMID
jgi:acyl-CoA reductase-like NAD-dependent aldehyde dehydrogenase